MRWFPTALLVLLLSGSAAPAFAGLHARGGPSTTNNNDSCDIALLPAATLLLPYFEVDVANVRGETTLFTVTNIGDAEQIARVTIWTDRAYPVFSFNLYLTGYDVQSINLGDVIRDGRIAPPTGTGLGPSPTGMYSHSNPALNVSACGDLPSQIPPSALQRVRQALTTGTIPASGNAPACPGVGDTSRRHPTAIGYVTIDVVASCETTLPTETAYYRDVIRHDNVLVGEYQQLNPALNFAQGGPLVHIRSIRGEDGKTNFPNTFYGRFQSAAQPKLDGRQPLPSAFAARFIYDEFGGAFRTWIKIWRQGWTGPGVPCTAYKCNAKLQIVEFVTFDDEENAVGAAPNDGPVCTPIVLEFVTSAVVKAPMDRSGSFFPEPFWDANNGWIYMNLAVEDEPVARQAWVTSSMEAAGRFSVDTAAVALGNGCSPAAALSEIDPRGTVPVGPAPSVNP
ncbi:MAG TPA: hypothetical protein VF911_21455 [Thermoanaerobaculia bacterium]|jgi:hypothetical protein